MSNYSASLVLSNALIYGSRVSPPHDGISQEGASQVNKLIVSYQTSSIT
jgi:hypothetical protein